MKLYDMELTEWGIPHLVEEKSWRYSSKVRTCQDVVDMLNLCFGLQRKAEEHVYLIALNSAGSIIGVFLLSKGCVNTSLCNAREIFIRLLACGAVSFIVAHNHPSGEVTPSDADIKVFRKLKEAGDLMTIRCLDSLIIGGDSYCSLRDQGY